MADPVPRPLGIPGTSEATSRACSPERPSTEVPRSLSSPTSSTTTHHHHRTAPRRCSLPPQPLHNRPHGRDSRTVVSEPARPGISRENTMASSVYSSNSMSSFRREDDSLWARRNRLSKFGGKIPSVVGDPRYALLEKALSTKYDKRIKTSVTDIVDTIESLHKPPKSAKEAKPKWEEKIYAFMKEVGISWSKD